MAVRSDVAALMAIVGCVFATTCCEAADNVDTAATDVQRVAHMYRLIVHTVDQLDRESSAAYRKNTVIFLMRLAWHESADLKHRRQMAGGPARGFFQFEAGRAKDAIDYAVRKRVVGRLASSGGSTTTRIQRAASTLQLGKPWPEGNLIERLLGGKDDAVDLFGCYLARIELKKIPAAFPGDLDGQAVYWADHWKRVFNPASSRADKIEQFKRHARELQPLLRQVVDEESASRTFGSP